MKKERKVILPILLVFIIVNVFLLTATSFLTERNVDRDMLLIANLVFFAISMVVFFMQKKGLQNPNPHVFIRSVMGGMMIKMFICIALVMGYVILAGSSYNKPAVFISLFLYIIYLTVEVAAIMRLNKKKDA